ncbi:MAG: TolC family protein [Candidatus Obscuribacterales bacterium]
MESRSTRMSRKEYRVAVSALLLIAASASAPYAALAQPDSTPAASTPSESGGTGNPPASISPPGPNDVTPTPAPYVSTPAPSPGAEQIEEQFTKPTGPVQLKSTGQADAQAAQYAAGPASPPIETLLSEQERIAPKTLPLNPVKVQELIPIGNGRLPPIKLEATYNQPISLREVLGTVIDQNLAIKISKAGMDSQRYLFYGAVARYLPDFNILYRTQDLFRDQQPSVNTRIWSNTLRMPVFQGGRITFGALSNYHRYKSAQFAYSTTINDSLLAAYQAYNNVLLQQVLLQIRVQAVEVSRAQLRINQQQKNAGTGTNFAVMQSTTQLALDKQALLQQQLAVRQASLQLAAVMSMNVGVNLLPLESQVTESRLWDENVNVNELLATALRLRPELGQLQHNRIAQTRQIQVLAAPLYPTAQFFLSTNRSEGGSSGSGSSANLGNITGTGSAGTGAGGSGIQGVGATGIGGAAAAATNTVVIPGGGGTGLVVGSGAGKTTLTAGFDLTWSIASLGVPDAMNVQSQRYLARQALLQYNQQVISVTQQVRSSYLSALVAEEAVDVAGEGVVASTEGLRLANLRLRHGAGTNLEVIQAQRDYIQSLVNQAQAIVAYNNAQAQLLHDTGQISLATLTTQIKQPISAAPLKLNLN